MKRKSKKLKLKKAVVRVLDSEGIKPVIGGGKGGGKDDGTVPDGYGYSLNRNNCKG